jgi:hypothetical protein
MSFLFFLALLADAKDQLNLPNMNNLTSTTTMEMFQSSLMLKITRSVMEDTTVPNTTETPTPDLGSTTNFDYIKYTTMKPCKCILFLFNEILNKLTQFLWLLLSVSVIIPTLPEFRHKIIHSRPYQSKHNHDHHWGPFFEEPLNVTSGALQVGFHLGTEAILNCRVGMLKDKTVIICNENFF